MANEEIIVSAVKKLEAKPGDCIMVEVEGHPSMDYLHRMEARFKLHFPGVQVLFFHKMRVVGVMTSAQMFGKESIS